MFNESRLQVVEGSFGSIGLGNIGFGRAMNREDDFVEQAQGFGGVEVASSARDVAEQCDVIITSLPYGDAVRQVFTDPTSGLLGAPQSAKPKLYLDTSTIEISMSLEVLQAIAECNARDFLDAPVSGGILSAAEGQLTFMVGRSEELFHRAQPILLLMGEECFHCGKPGAGLATNQINNYVANWHECGVKYGLDLKILSDVINASSGSCWNSLHMNPIKGVQANSSASRDFKGGFKTELAKGVIDMAVQLMDEVQAKHVLGNVVKDAYARAVESPLCKEQERRGVFRLFIEDDGKCLGRTKIE